MLDAARSAFDECIEFGERLLDTRDLDPVYCAIVDTALPTEQVKRLLLSYWCYYHLGVAAYLSEYQGAAYWRLALTAARNAVPSPGPGGRWPRATERRHFRGDKCVMAIEWLMARGTPEELVTGFTLYHDSQGLMDEVKSWPMFGPWISFKVADMLERCLGVPIALPPSVPLLYREPRAALALLPVESYARLLQHFATRRAPPALDRYCGPAEVETILCKFKSMRGGHYRVGKDIHEVSAALVGWGITADRLREAMPGVVT